MHQITENEKEIIRWLAKDFSTYYNARSLSKQVQMSHRGTLKALKNLEKLGILKSKTIGRAIIYKILYCEYTKKLLPLLFFEEAETKTKRWMEEFKELKEANALILFGSVLRGKGHHDIDLLIISETKNTKILEQRIEEKNRILTKPIHPIWQTIDDLNKNIKNNNKVLLEIIKTGIVIKGQELITKVLGNATNRE
ncbi:nucleotidyltransferase domain-containing protein [Candidatus Woesearchaeota archaeon]|nr:nucleotidyltransferase domain-containing protein [Candidatus Woesearchaeota archaeon]